MTTEIRTYVGLTGGPGGPGGYAGLVIGKRYTGVGLDKAQGCFVVPRSFNSSVPLEDYAMGVVLSLN